MNTLAKSALISVGLEHVKFARADTLGVLLLLSWGAPKWLKCGKNVRLVYWYCVLGAQMSC